MSNKTTLKQIRAGLGDLILRLDGSGDLATYIPPAHVYKPGSAEAMSTKDAAYPKAVIAFDGGISKLMVGRATERSVVADLVFTFKSTKSNQTDPTEQAESCYEDMEAILSADRTLGGLVTSVVLEEWTTDSGYAAPEGLCLCRLRINYSYRS